MPLTLRNALTARGDFCWMDFGGLVVGTEDELGLGLELCDGVLDAGVGSVFAFRRAITPPTAAPTTMATTTRPTTSHVIRLRRVVGRQLRLVVLTFDSGLNSAT